MGLKHGRLRLKICKAWIERRAYDGEVDVCNVSEV